MVIWLVWARLIAVAADSTDATPAQDCVVRTGTTEEGPPNNNSRLGGGTRVEAGVPVAQRAIG